MEPVYVFVYGTLKRGWGNNRILQTSSLFVSEAVTKEKYLMLGRGIPYVLELNKPHEYARPILGEVWLVQDQETLDRLDRLEGVAYNHYRRKLIKVRDVKGGLFYDAYIYFSASHTSEDINHFRPSDQQEYYEFL